MKIHEAEAITQIPKKSIRYYEAEGLLHPNRESGNGYRVYTSEDIAALRRIRLLRKLGLPIEEIRRVFEGSLTLAEALERQKILLSHSKNDIEQRQQLCERLCSELAGGSEPDLDSLLDRVMELEQSGVQFADVTADRKKEMWGVWLSCVGFALFMLAFALLILWAYEEDPIPLGLFLFIESFIVLPAIGVFFAGRARIKEIKGGEEDDLSQY